MNPADSSAEHNYMLGGYEIVSTAGAGGMGVVYKAIDPALGRPVAIKVLKEEFQAHPAVVARFRREAEAIATLSHPNIVRIYAVGSESSVPFIAMEYVEGAPLSDILSNCGSLPWEEALDIGIQVADALVCAHECQVIHRDIKPANILLCDDGSVKVTDFGIAKVLNASTQLTVDGARIGTPQYMCPERCKNLPTTPSSDIYSLGVMLFQCITGRLPFEASGAADLITKISYEIPKRIRAFKPDVPESVDRLIAYMLEKEASNRPETSRVLRDIIDRVRRGDRVAEVLPAMELALETIRAETPAPDMPSESTVDSRPDFSARLRHRWFALSRASRIAVAVFFAVVVPVSLAIGLWVSLVPAVDVSTRFHAFGDVERWTQRQSLATFQRETDTVVSGHIALSGFQIRSLNWIDGADGAVAWLEGIPNGSRAGETALLTINPYLHTVNVSLTPLPPVDGDVAMTLLGAGSYGVSRPGVFLASGEGTSFLGTLPGGLPEVLLPWKANRVAIADREGTAALARMEKDGGSDIVFLAGDTSALRNKSIYLRGEIVVMASHQDSAQLAVLHREGNWSGITLIATRFADQEGSLIREGEVLLHRNPFSPSGGQLVLTDEMKDGMGRVVVQSAYEPESSTIIGAGMDAAWRPGSDELILIAPDHAGRSQLWRYSATNSFSAQQLTHLDSGVGSQLSLSEDGRYALIEIPESTSFVAVDLMVSSLSGQ